MKQLSFLSKLLFIALLASMVASCEDTTGGGTTIEASPVASLESGVDFVTGSASIGAEDVFKVKFLADKGDNDMSTIAILEDGVEVDASRLNYNGAGYGVVSNPYTLLPTEVSAFSAEIEIISHSDASTRTYTFRATDTKGNIDEDFIDITTSTGPLTISFTQMAPFTFGDITLDQPTSVKFQINATKGGAALESIAVLEDDVAISDMTRLRYNTADDLAGAFNFDTNPQALTGDAQQSFSWIIWVGTHSDESTKEYAFQVTDADGNVEEVSLNITIDLPATGTPITSDLTGKLLLNAGGPAGTGGIDLITGNGTGSSDPLATLKDQGIDTSQPTASNWVRKIAPVNGAILRKPAADFPTSGIGFVQFTEEISDAFDAGSSITESDVILVGDVFLVQDVSGNIFIVEVTNVVETSGDNDDYYELAIKR